ncbi:MAG: hypothetical protein LBG09_01835 [Puniceicoccales bacterium]|jgi:hypothetical protein|nr:hypothetical protein [Puniceicoccales bacterium]
MSIGKIVNDPIGALEGFSKTPAANAVQSAIAQMLPNHDTKEATKAASDVEGKSIDDIQKSKLSLQSICSGIKNLVLALAKKINLFIETAKSLTPEEKQQILKASAKGAALVGTIGGVVGTVLPGVGNFLGSATGGAIAGCIIALIELNKIAKQHAERMDAINDQAQQAQAPKEGELPEGLAAATA